MGFFERVYEVVKQIPKGKVSTYGQIAKILGAPRGAKFVGYALHKNLDPQNVPCHRVVNRKGEISSAFAFGGPDEQRKRLEREGVVFDKNGRIDLNKYGMQPLDFIDL